MAEIIDLDFYRKFRIILPIRINALELQSLQKDKAHVSPHHTKRFRRRRKVDSDPKTTTKD